MALQDPPNDGTLGNGESCGRAHEEGKGIGADNAGNLYLLMTLDDLASFGPDAGTLPSAFPAGTFMAALVRLKPDGGEGVWVAPIHTGSNGTTYADVSATAPNGISAVGGNGTGAADFRGVNGAPCTFPNAVSSSSYFYYLLTYNSAGVCVNSLAFGCGPSATLDVAVDPVTGDTYGLFELNTTTAPITCNINGTNVNVSQRTLGIGRSSLDGGFARTFLPVTSGTPAKIAAQNGRVWVAGTFSGSLALDAGITTAGDSDIFMVSVDNVSLNVIPKSVQRLGSSGDERVVGLDYKNDGSLWLTADFTGASLNLGAGEMDAGVDGGRAIVAAQFTVNATTLQWSPTASHQLFQQGSADVAAHSVGPDDSLHLGGTFRGQVGWTAASAVTSATPGVTPAAFYGRQVADAGL